MSDPKYEGKRTSRAQLEMESEEESGLEDDEEDEELQDASVSARHNFKAVEIYVQHSSGTPKRT